MGQISQLRALDTNFDTFNPRMSLSERILNNLKNERKVEIQFEVTSTEKKKKVQ